MKKNLALFLLVICQIGFAVELTTLEVATIKEPALIADSLDVNDSLNQPDTVEYRAVDLLYSYPEKTFYLNKKAQLKYKGATLNADTILFDQENKVLLASGIPRLQDQENPPITGLRMKYNLNSKVGQIFYGSSYRDAQQFNGMDIRRLKDGRLQIARGDFSTCDDPEHQHYYFYSRRMMIKPKESVVARPVVLNIADVPVAVLPILVNPIQDGRHSGLLTPRFGGDQAQGFYVQDVGFYWAISDYMDWTIKGDLIEGPEANFERTTASSAFRYKKRYVLDGHVNAKSYLQEFSFANSGWDVDFAHKQNLTPDGKSELSGRGSFVSDRRLRQDQGIDKETVLNQQANAYLTYRKQFSGNKTLTVNTKQNQNLTTGHLERELPDIQFSMSGPLIPIEGEDGMDTSLEVRWYEKINYTYSPRANVFYQSDPDTSIGKDTSRTWVGFKDNLRIDYQTTLWEVLNIRPSINYSGNWTAYSYRDPPEDSLRRVYFQKDFEKGEVGDFFYHHYYQLDTDTKLYGIWRPDWKRFTGLRHTLAPGLGYRYAPEIDTNYHFVPHPLLGQVPWQNEEQTVLFSLGNDFDIKYPGQSPNEDPSNSSGAKRNLKPADNYSNLRILSTTSNTSYNFAKDFRNWDFIRSRVDLQLVRSYLFSVNMIHSLYDDDNYFAIDDSLNQVQNFRLMQYSYNLRKNFNWNGRFNAGHPSTRGNYTTPTPWNAGFSYSYGHTASRVSENLFRINQTHSASANMGIQPTENWKMDYNTRYNFQEGEFAEHVFTFSRILHCWRMQFQWTPVGAAEGWSFYIHITDLPDIKFQTASTKVNGDLR